MKLLRRSYTFVNSWLAINQNAIYKAMALLNKTWLALCMATETVKYDSCNNHFNLWSPNTHELLSFITVVYSQ